MTCSSRFVTGTALALAATTGLVLSPNLAAETDPGYKMAVERLDRRTGDVLETTRVECPDIDVDCEGPDLMIPEAVRSSAGSQRNEIPDGAPRTIVLKLRFDMSPQTGDLRIRAAQDGGGFYRWRSEQEMPTDDGATLTAYLGKNYFLDDEAPIDWLFGVYRFTLSGI